ncbi:hypothetical protein VUN82_19445 [Micrococcaceae bacterium Sec5.1]
MREQYIDTASNVVTRFRTIDEFVERGIAPKGIISINESGVPIDLLNSDIGADTTVVFFHGAIEPHYRVPVLTGQGISNGLNANRVFVSDPSLYLSSELALAWYAGNHKQDLQSLLLRVISHVVSSHGAKRVIYFGGSGGGFASLYYSSQTPGSAAVVYNPQTDITKYHSRAVRSFAQIAYGIPEDEYDPLSSIRNRPVTNLCPLYAKPLANKVYYMQNSNDQYHVKRHMEPFLAAASGVNDVEVLMDAWREGHTPPPKELLSETLRRFCESSTW